MVSFLKIKPEKRRSIMNKKMLKKSIGIIIICIESFGFFCLLPEATGDLLMRYIFGSFVAVLYINLTALFGVMMTSISDKPQTIIDRCCCIISIPLGLIFGWI